MSFYSIYDVNYLIKQYGGSSKTKYLVFKSYEGRIIVISEFYYFLFAVLIPLFEYHFNNPNFQLIIISDIGSMKSRLIKLFESLNINISFESCIDHNYINLYPDFISFELLNNFRLSNQPLKIPLLENDNHNNDYFLLPAYDVFLGDLYFDHFNKPFNYDLQNKIINLMLNSFNKSQYDKTFYDVIYIRRYVLTDEELLEKNKLYTFRRSIQNSDKFEKKLKKICDKLKLTFITLKLEKITLLEQFYLFYNAKTVIAQHGAGLSNIFYMKPKMNVIEISTSYSDYCKKRELTFDNTKIRNTPTYRFDRFRNSHFMNLANYCNLNYNFIDSMNENIGNIKIKYTIKRIYKILINKFSNPYINSCVEPYIKKQKLNYSSMYWKISDFNESNNEYIHYKNTCIYHLRPEYQTNIYLKYIDYYKSDRYIEADTSSVYFNEINI